MTRWGVAKGVMRIIPRRSKPDRDGGGGERGGARFSLVYIIVVAVHSS